MGLKGKLVCHLFYGVSLMHDSSYKTFFSNPKMVEALLSHFIQEQWVHCVDWSTLERISSSYVADDFRERHSDLIWRVRLTNDEFLYLYLLIEFQSQIDRFMAVRLITYIGLFFQDLIRKKCLIKNKFLPPVFPLVLYNGPRLWKQPIKIEKLYTSLPPELMRYQPQLQFHLIDENAYSWEQLNVQNNVAAILIQLENSSGTEEMERTICKLVNALHSDPVLLALQGTFTEWLTKFVLPSRFPEHEIEPIQNLMEIIYMLNRRGTAWTTLAKEEGLRQGIQQGLEQGLEKGLEQGKKEIALFMLQNNEPMEKIIRYTGLTSQQILSLCTKH